MLKLKNFILNILIKSFSRLPFFIIYIFSDLLYLILNYIVKYRSEVIVENLRNSFPSKSEKEILLIKKQFYKNFADQMTEGLKLLTISRKDLSERLVYENSEDITQWIEKGRSVVIAAGHYGNWEYASGFPFALPGFDQYDVIYSKITDPFFDNLILKSREKFGCHMISMKDTFREILKHENHGHLYGFIFDQSPHKSLIRYQLNFLNQTSPVHLGTEQVATKKDAVVIYFEVNRVKRGHYKVKTEILTENPKELKKFELTHLLFEKLEKSIENDPASWLWSHKRWKYKEGIDYNLK